LVNGGFRVEKEMKTILVLGGARSGKSTYSLRLANSLFDKPLYIATAEAGDREMAERIRIHKQSRSRHWKCLEEPLDVASVIASAPRCDGILIDCMTLWVSNVLLKEGEKAFAKREKELLAALRKARCPVIIVSNEVGLGIVPEHVLGRKFRDMAGRLNQDLAEFADTVVFVVSGLPMVLKGKIQEEGRQHE
jgi:adenosylcobinamide kinase / adenosylcobinamide-phosphate guanylyltransferase